VLPCEKCGGKTRVVRVIPRWRGGGTYRKHKCETCPHVSESVQVSRAAFEKRVATAARKLFEKVCGPLPAAQKGQR
jgi:hypothetical protein